MTFVRLISKNKFKKQLQNEKNFICKTNAYILLTFN